jgi:hypothetical protein
MRREAGGWLGCAGGGRVRADAVKPQTPLKNCNKFSVDRGQRRRQRLQRERAAGQIMLRNQKLCAIDTAERQSA